MPHRIDAAYCHGRSVLCVCLLFTAANPTKTDETIEMPFGIRTRVGRRNHVSGGDSDPPRGRGNFEVISYREYHISCVIRSYSAGGSSDAASCSSRRCDLPAVSDCAERVDVGRTQLRLSILVVQLGRLSTGR